MENDGKEITFECPACNEKITQKIVENKETAKE
jgi:hypothetical protein